MDGATKITSNLGNRTVGGEEASNGSGTKLGTVADGRHRNGNGKRNNETAIIQRKKTQATTRLLEQLRFYYIIGASIVIGLIIIASFRLFYQGTDTSLEEEFNKKFGPYISDSLGLSFPGQYANIVGTNPRLEAYHLTKEEREIAIKKLQDVLQNTNKVIVRICDWDLKTNHRGFQEYMLAYDDNLVAKLCEPIDLVGDTVIPTMLTPMSGPDIVFTLYPSEINFNFLSNKTMYITLGKGHQAWKGDMSLFRISCLERIRN